MKKKYVKPEIAFESFQLSTTITTCEILSTNSAQYVCLSPVEDPDTGWMLFAEANNLCDTVPVNGTVCYDVPTANWNVMSS